MRTGLTTVFLIVLCLCSCAPIDANTADSITQTDGAQSFQVNTLMSNLETPWGLDFLPDGSMLVTEREGRMHRLNPSTGDSTQIGGIPATHVYGQGGLLDVAVHPNFADNRYVYISYSYRTAANDYTTRLSRGRLRNDQLTDIEHLFDAEPAFTTVIHFGSALLFDNDGYIRMTMGDRGKRHEAQKLGSSLGKTYRLTDDGKPAPGNPFEGIPNVADEVYSYGHRNPQGITIDRNSGRIWTAEHGPRGGDEVNLLKMGYNYGWPVITYGEEYRGGKIGEGTAKQGMEQPIHYYVPSIATAAIEYYDGDAFPQWKDSLFVCGLKSQSLSRLQLSGDQVVSEQRLLEDLHYRIREVRQGPDGLLYLLVERGQVVQIAPVR